MKISTRKITWMSVSFAFAVLTGMPAVADDTELLLVNPDPSQTPTPNVMFILDTSGSMTTTQSTIDPYDSEETYGDGDCDTDKYYWTDVDVIPDCATTKNVIDADKYVCEFSSNQIGGIGSYTDTMVQYRDDPSSGNKNWQTLASGYTGEYVECQADSGRHGDGIDTDRVYAESGSDKKNLWTKDSDKEISWGSSPRNISYTVYSGNYMNWKAQPDNVVMSRSEIMKSVATQVLSSVNNLNVGLMHFNPNPPGSVGFPPPGAGQGASVVLDMMSLDDNRQAVLDAVKALPADGYTPLSETMYENALFWRGMAAEYADRVTAITDTRALASTAPMTYEQPEWDVCAKNYNVYLTDGEPTEDDDTPDLIANLPNIGTTLGYTGCDGSGDGYCLDDIAQYLSLEDVDPNTDGDQLVTTHTIGFTVDLEILKETAENSGGSYFLAEDVETLTQTLLSIIASINDRSLSFTAPAVSVNTFNRTQNLNDLYITTFGAKSSTHWPGNLKKYRIADRKVVDVNGNDAVDPATGFFFDTARSYWTTGGADGNDVLLGGAAQQLPTPSIRDLYTNNTVSGDLTAAANHVTPSNASSFQDSDFGLTGATGEPTMDELIRWARGEDVLDEDNNASTTVRKAMGDPLHSQPAPVVYGGSETSPDVVIYTATNDGYLHAIDGATGAELWSFIPKELLSNLTRLYFDPDSKYKQYGIDGNVIPIVKDVDLDGIIEPNDGDFVQLIFGMRRGGNSYYSIDVTDKTSPNLLWSKSVTASGESWSTPIVARMDIGSVSQNTDKGVVVIGGGYDTVHDTSAHPTTADGAGAGLHILDLKTGAELWRAGSDTAANLTLSGMTRAIPNTVRVIPCV